MKILVKLQTPHPPPQISRSHDSETRRDENRTLIAFLVYLSHLAVLVGQVVVGPAVHVRTRRRRRSIRCRPRFVGGGGQRFARTVAGAQGSLVHQFGGHSLQVVSPSDQRERIDEKRGQVQFVVE